MQRLKLLIRPVHEEFGLAVCKRPGVVVGVGRGGIRGRAMKTGEMAAKDGQRWGRETDISKDWTFTTFRNLTTRCRPPPGLPAVRRAGRPGTYRKSLSVPHDPIPAPEAPLLAVTRGTAAYHCTAGL
eukprot:551428-Hanusia_phi.AAC.2